MKINNLQLKIPWLLSFVIAVITLLIVNFPVRAQEISLSITPPITEITIQPGKTINQTFTVEDNSTPAVIIPKIIPFVPLDSLGHVELLEDQNSVNAFSNWFSFDQSPVSLQMAESHNFSVKITPPAGTEEKDYYFTFIAEVQPGAILGVNSSQAQARIGANILVTISKDGNPQKKASISEFSAPKVIDSFSNITYKVLVQNSGASFFKPDGTITVDQTFGSSTTLGLAPLNVLVGGTREISCIEGQELVPCTLPGKFLIGIYRANLSLTTDASGSAITRQVYTVAFPFSLLLGLIVVFVIYRIIRKLTA